MKRDFARQASGIIASPHPMMGALLGNSLQNAFGIQNDQLDLRILLVGFRLDTLGLALFGGIDGRQGKRGIIPREII